MTGLARRRIATGFAALACLVATGCVNGGSDPGVPAGSFRLVFFDSCEQALNGLRAAATAVVGPYGFNGGLGFGWDSGGRDGVAVPPPQMGNGAPEPAKAGDAPNAGAPPDPSTPEYSGTNTHEAGVDEPDLVKTDGRRIVTVSAGRLTVVDAATRRLVGAIDLGENGRGAEGDILLSGDHALVMSSQAVYPGVIVEDSAGPMVKHPDVVAGTSLILVDLTGPQVISRGRADGSIVDARQVGSMVRLVVRSVPRLEFPMPQQGSDAERIAANKAVINASTIDDWMPRLEVTTDGRTTQSQVGCDALSRPAFYSGTNLLTVLSFDLGQNSLSDGQPVSVVADGDTVYSNGDSLYVASNQAWRPMPMVAGAPQAMPAENRTEIYKFDIRSSDRPRYVAGGSVPGHLLNQYSMSDREGLLRVASTTDTFMDPARAQPGSQSGVYVLAQDGERLVEIGAVEGLGKGERIYAVRFIESVAYVVTFRQTDPLYTIDLGDPRKPTVRGELKIPGYSAYLHPAGGGHLIGVGQDATNEGRVLGTQVSLFDVGNLADPTRLAKYTLSGTYSEAEFDPHAFLYWPASGLLVVPLEGKFGIALPVEPNGGPGSSSPDIMAPDGYPSASGALVLRVGDGRISEIGFLSHPGTINNGGYPMPIRRSLIIESTLWTVSAGGLMATDSRTLDRLAWIPLA